MCNAQKRQIIPHRLPPLHSSTSATEEDLTECKLFLPSPPPNSNYHIHRQAKPPPPPPPPPVLLRYTPSIYPPAFHFSIVSSCRLLPFQRLLGPLPAQVVDGINLSTQGSRADQVVLGHQLATINGGWRLVGTGGRLVAVIIGCGIHPLEL